MSTIADSHSSPTAIESDSFPFAELSDVAELESWRKEVNRPIYHIHKWWAQRLGTVFRAILLGAVTPPSEDFIGAFYKQASIPQDTVVFDPFMGSGTTIGEALKIGLRAIGRDINPVAFFSVKTALTKYDRNEVLDTFACIQEDVEPAIQHYYRTLLPSGIEGQVLYYFWVKTVVCVVCEADVRLFARYRFAHHAYPRRYPQAQIICPQCGTINVDRYDADTVTCSRCGLMYAPAEGPARGAHATCSSCGTRFAIIRAIEHLGSPPNHELYAKLVLNERGEKTYLPADDFDRVLYAEAERELERRERPFPIVRVDEGYNTKQAMNYGYRYWHEFFNARQLLSLSLLGDRIRKIDNPAMRDLFVCLFSGTLEFNNMFASYKGEGTGAVRHMFSHHVLKPERTPLEANVWGTPKSSGAFSTLFRSRLLKALDYQERPFEIAVKGSDRAVAKKVYGLSTPMGQKISASYADFSNGGRVYLSTGDSASTDLPDESVDLVVTDPPFFDNVHYSELADFFYVWQRHLTGDGSVAAATTTRHPGEVQSEDAPRFATKLAAVFKECSRVLRRDGLLVFTYHHSRLDGWSALHEALQRAGFRVVAAHPIKAEMSSAAPKRLAGSPIDLDVILVCRQDAVTEPDAVPDDPLDLAQRRTAAQVERFSDAGRSLSRNDLQVVLMAQFLVALSDRQDTLQPDIDVAAGAVEKILDDLANNESTLRTEVRRSLAGASPASFDQLSLGEELAEASA